jgi:hypothetical protein
MENVLLPSLSQDGWVSSTKEKLDYLMSHFFLSDYSQTSIYSRHVASLSYILQANQNKMIDTKNAVTTTLTDYLSRYKFTDVIVDVGIKEEEPGSVRQIMSIYISITDHENKNHTFSSVIETNESKFSKVIQLNNEG